MPLWHRSMRTFARPALVLCAEGADLAFPGGPIFWSDGFRTPGAVTDAVTEQPDRIARVPRDYLA
jgi:hypothetical protein